MANPISSTSNPLTATPAHIDEPTDNHLEFMGRQTQTTGAISLTAMPRSNGTHHSETDLLTRIAELSITPDTMAAISKPSPTPVYQGLQNVFKIAAFQGIDPESQTLRWTINNPNLVEKLLAPWDKSQVESAMQGMRDAFHTIKPEHPGMVINDRETNPIANYAAVMALSTLQNFGARGKPGNYDATGHQLTQQDIGQILSLIRSTSTWQSEFFNDCRGVSISSADALFVPSDLFITKDLADPSNSASDQKSSSTLLAPNTPVYILAQLPVSPDLNMAEESWLAIWRPEFGLKFVKSRHVSLISQKDIDRYSQIHAGGHSGSLRMTLTDRVKEAGTFSRLPIGTPLPACNMTSSMTAHQDVMMAKCTFAEHRVKSGSADLCLYRSELQRTKLRTVDAKGILDRQVKAIPLPLNNRNFLTQITNNMLKFPADLVPIKANENRCFAWGEGTIGPDGERGQDISTFISKTVRPFGTWLPRHSLDQINEGKEVEGSRTSGDSKEENYQALLTHGQPGTFASWGKGNNMICLGNVSLSQLRILDQDAANNALTSGMAEYDRIPLLALSPIALTTRELNGTIHWHHSGRTAVYPVFREGCHSTFIREGRKLQFYRYFSEIINIPSPIKANDPGY